MKSLLRYLLFAVFFAAPPNLFAQNTERPAKAIQDNSFFIEEAYNQEAGVVQHIFNLSWNVDQHGSDEHEYSLVFTQEWPVFGQTHQFSYTVPYTWLENGESVDGFEDVLLNYRFQALTETNTQPAFAPRLSLILPTGDEDEGLGNDTLGFQINLPVSKIVSDRWTLHGNAGMTVLPDVQGHDLMNFNFGGSAIFAVAPEFNLMLELLVEADDEVDDDGGVGREVSAIVSPGFRYAFNLKNDAQLVVGVAAPIGITSDAPDYGVFFYCSFEHSFAR
jgi:Putative MetA-pathway of phenol degradation